MVFVLNTPASIVLLAGLLALAFWVFGRVRADYRALGRLSPFTAVIQTGYFCVYALCSYAFLDSRLAYIRISGALLGLAIALMVAGFVIVLFSMPFLGRRSFGHETGSLRTSGLYHYSRNPQLVGGFLFMLGYAMLWPSWQGAVWAGLWLVVAWLMVRAEEEHLRNIFGEPYHEYCDRTPRYIGLPGR